MPEAMRAPYLHRPDGNVVTKADRSHTGMKDLGDRGADEERQGIIKERNVDRWTVKASGPQSCYQPHPAITCHQRRIQLSDHLFRLPITNVTFLCASGGRDRLEENHKLEEMRKNDRE